MKESSDLREELERLRATRLDWETEFKVIPPFQCITSWSPHYDSPPQAQTEKVVSDQRTALSKRDAEIARLREQRDQQMSELNERKQKDHVKLASLNEFKALAENRSVSSFLHISLSFSGFHGIVNRNV